VVVEVEVADDVGYLAGRSLRVPFLEGGEVHVHRRVEEAREVVLALRALGLGRLVCEDSDVEVDEFRPHDVAEPRQFERLPGREVTDVLTNLHGAAYGTDAKERPDRWRARSVDVRHFGVVLERHPRHALEVRDPDPAWLLGRLDDDVFVVREVEVVTGADEFGDEPVVLL